MEEQTYAFSCIQRAIKTSMPWLSSVTTIQMDTDNCHLRLANFLKHQTGSHLSKLWQTELHRYLQTNASHGWSECVVSTCQSWQIPNLSSSCRFPRCSTCCCCLTCSAPVVTPQPLLSATTSALLPHPSHAACRRLAANRLAAKTASAEPITLMLGCKLAMQRAG